MGPAPLTGASDNALVERSLAGEKGAFDELVRRHSQRVFTVARGIVRDPDDAADVLQETFIAVLRHLDTFDRRAQFSTWLHRIAMRKAYDLLRVRRPVPVEQAAEVPAGGDPFETRLQASGLVEAIAALDDAFRDAVLLVDVLGCPVEEAAATLDVAVGTVKSRVFRGRAALAALLGTAGLAPPSDRMHDD